MGKNTPSPPPQPDPQSVINQQTGGNINTAIGNAWMNNTNQVTPYGNVTYRQVASKEVGNGYSVPQFEAIQTLSPEQQKIYDTQTAISQGALDLGRGYIDKISAATAQPFSYDGLPEAGTAPTYDANYRQHAYDTILQRNQPQMERDQRALEQRLADQGIGLNDAGYRTAMDQYQRGVNDFRLGADLQAQQMASNDYNTALQGFGAQNTARDRAINERLQLRNQPINELTALLGLGGGGVRSPQFVNTPQTQIAPTDVAGIYANDTAARQNAWATQTQMQQSQQNALMGGLFGLGSAGLMAGMMPGGLFGLGAKDATRSDMRVKEDIRHIGFTHDGQNLYSFRYIGEPQTHIGLMAQEVEKIHPEAVIEIDGVKHVYYDVALREAYHG